MKITDATPLTAIRAALKADGYGALVEEARRIRQAASVGCLLWTPERLTTTDGSRIDARPARELER